MVDQPKSIYQKILQAEKASTVQEIVDRENSKQIRVHMPCKVIAIGANGATVDVEIQGQEDTGFGYYSKFPMLLDLPIVYNNYTSSAYIVTPVQVGDTGLVEFLDFNSTNFNNDGNTALTSDEYYHSLNNGVFINGFIPTSKQISMPTNSPIVIGLKNNTFKFIVDNNGNLSITSNGTTISGNITASGDFTCSGDVSCGNGVSGSFVSKDDKTVTVTNGIVTSIG